MPQDRHRQDGARNARDRRASEERQIASAIHSFHRDYNSTQSNRAQGDSKNRKLQQRATTAGIIYTVITACFFGASVYSISQAWYAVSAANQSANAATSQARIADETEKLQLRAYLGVIPGDLIDFGKPSQRLTITRHNFGQTPAYATALVYAGGAYLAALNAPHPVIRCHDYIHPQTPFSDLSSIFPNMDRPIIMSLDLKNSLMPNAEQVAAVINNTGPNEAPMYGYWGTFCYLDIFRQVHFSNFCFMYNGREGMTKPGANTCRYHNDSD